ncbi:grasp-with-spasm system SPASM domain peptide maturase [Chitinophaga nivalis]|uniref:Grasp-with-spasm system SPASM domain peptide maturase n=1 Tax=Chitinophaga nivalis TaxID=2991709 RepID=A0ABT3IMR3_9BACT|nr:grasp-with-spasm system SPASM domain peptide maturase [Chitinophaga nivalis]MCW3465058.1 grasp-with-spasm system SPASM domain peptide maturase [Chitinophaga nivalis]MCW3485250.1 grasp-with-spasm system SPASM domain peptide maturase [Chitinophaga nivalis]
MKTNIPFRLFTCCLPVEGAQRSVLCDVQRQSIHLIPNTLYEILLLHDGKTIEQVYQYYEHEQDEIIHEYFEFLLREEFIFFTETPAAFPPMDLTWDEPYPVTNAIIDLDAATPPLPWPRLIHELETLGCQHIQLRCFSDHPLTFFEDILQQLEHTRILSAELIIKYQDHFTQPMLVGFCSLFKRITLLTLHTTPFTETVFHPPAGNARILYIPSPIDAATHCGHIIPDYFSINIKTFTESQQYNTCLNRKISIDAAGNIKNCPSMKDSFGNVYDSTLLAALAHPAFKKYWHINKNQISVCKDCEFRHICTDCRAYLENPQDILSKPLKCGYNPYTCEWEDWSQNPLKEHAIAYYFK